MISGGTIVDMSAPRRTSSLMDEERRTKYRGSVGMNRVSRSG